MHGDGCASPVSAETLFRGRSEGMRTKRGLERALVSSSAGVGPSLGEGPASERDSDPFRRGAIIADKFRIERVLGEGAMGIVLAARHLVLDEMVAIKCVRNCTPEHPERRALRAGGQDRCATAQRSIARVLDVAWRLDSERTW